MNAETGRKFHFIRVIASGGFGSVYLAKELHADGFARVVAVKLLHPKWSENEEIASRMRDEARLLGQLRHRHIVDVRDLTRIDGRVAVVMEYLEAVDIKDIVAACQAQSAVVPVRVALEIFADVASALDAAYNRPPYAGEKPLRVIHRDIKPSNVMLDDQGHAKVLDFGVARADFQGRESETQELAFGSVEYMPPERLFFEPESPASDIYSLGATLYEMLAREKFGKAKLRPALHDQHVDARLDVVFGDYPAADESVRDEIDLLLTEMLSFDEADRPSAADCSVRLRELAGQLGHEPPLALWARNFVPPLLKQAQADADATPADDELVNRVLEEDSKGFVRGPNGPATLPPGEPVFNSSADRAFEALKQQSQGQTPPMAERRGPDHRPPPPDSEGARPAGLGLPPPPPRRSNAKATPATEVYRVERPGTEPPPEAVPVENAPRRAPAATAVMAPPPRREPEDDLDLEPRKSGAGIKVAAAALATVAIGGALIVAIGAAVMMGPSLLAGDGAAAPAPAPVAAAPVEEAPAEPVAGPHATFTSGLAGTRKLSVRCENGEGEGESSAVVAGEALGDCTVTAMDSSRLRLTAVVEGAVAGEYTCFVGGERTCE